MATNVQKLMTADEMKERITPEVLEKSAQTFQRQLLTMPIEVLRDETLKYITLVPGVRNALTFGELSGDAQLGPWSKDNREDADYKIVGRTLYVYPGNATKDFDPMEVFQSIYGHHIMLGDNPTEMQLAREVLAFFAAKIGKNLNDHVWDAVRNVNGKKTVDLFDGFDTIIAKEIAAGEVSEGAKNLFMFQQKLDETNTVKALNDFYESAHPELQKRDTFMYLDPAIYRNYLKDYQARNGALPYNTDYKKLTLETSFGKCTFAPLNNLAGSGTVKISLKQNFLLGTDINNQESVATVKEYAPWVYTFKFAGVYGAQVRTLSPEALFVGKLVTGDAAAPAAEAGKENGGDSGDGNGGDSGDGNGEGE